MRTKISRSSSIAVVLSTLALGGAAAAVSSCTAEFEVRCPDGTVQTAGGGDVNVACTPIGDLGGAGGAGGQGGALAGGGQGGTAGGPTGGSGEGGGGGPLVCTGEDQACDGACVDVRVSNQHCGACGKACSGTCQTGACVPVTQLALGGSHSCALLKDGVMKCWGDNSTAQLGDGAVLFRPKPAQVNRPNAFGKIVAGDKNTCGVTSQGQLECWGDNGLSQTSVPELSTLNFFYTLSLGLRHSCGLAKDNEDNGRSIYCWGSDSYGALGNGNLTGSFGRVDGLSSADPIMVATGAEFACALGDLGGDDGGIHCWGRNDQGQLCNGGLIAAGAPVTSLGGMTGFVSVTTGATHGCARSENGRVFCWGDNRRGQTGDQSASPKLVIGTKPTIEPAMAVVAGYDHTCAIQQSGDVYCWGANDSGQLGDGSATDRVLPTKVTGLDAKAVEIAGGAEHTCARLEDESVYCWGKNDRGQLGDGTTTNRSTPTRVVF